MFDVKQSYELNVVYQIMEVLDFTLSEFVHEKFLDNVVLSQANIKHIVREVMQGIMHMHSKNIIHRDLKPGTCN